MTAPSWTLQTPSSGASGVPASESIDQASKFFGLDIWFDVAMPGSDGQATYVVTPAGDVTVASGREALRQSLTRRLITNPGDWKTVPEYGVGARQYVKGKNTPSRRAELESRIRAQFMRDPRVLRVALAMVTPLDDGSPGLRVSVSVIPVGRLRSDQALPVQIEVR